MTGPAEEVEKLAQLQKMWALRKPILDAHILSLQGKVLELEQEIDGIVMKKLSNEQFHSYPANWIIFKKLDNPMIVKSVFDTNVINMRYFV